MSAWNCSPKAARWPTAWDASWKPWPPVTDWTGWARKCSPYGVDTLYVADDRRMAPYTSLPHTSLLVNLFKELKPQVALMGSHLGGARPGTARVIVALQRADCRLHVARNWRLRRQEDGQSVPQPALPDTSRFRRQHRGHDCEPRMPSPNGHRARRRDEKGNTRRRLPKAKRCASTWRSTCATKTS